MLADEPGKKSAFKGASCLEQKKKRWELWNNAFGSFDLKLSSVPRRC